jgi:multidrug resistance efflux pump
MLGNRLRLRPFAPLALLAALTLGGLAGVWAGCAGGGAQAEGEAGHRLVVRRGTLQPRVLLTGELTSARAEPLTVPRTEVIPLQVRWLAEDGAEIKAGDRVVEFDNSQFTSKIEEKRLAVAEASNELVRLQAEGRTNASEKTYKVEQAESELKKARIAANIPEGVLATREYQERQTALRRAEVELAKAREDQAALRKENEASLAMQRITRDKSLREIETAERAIQVLTLKAPRDGIVVVAEHPWEGRKFQQGDSVFPGMRVASLPDLGSLQIEAVLSDVDDGKVQVGMPVVATLDAYPAVRYTGRVIEVQPVARELNRNPLLRFFPVTVALDRSDPARMRPGMSVRVEVQPPAQGSALLAPRAGLDLGAKPPRARLAGGGTAEVKLGPCSALDCVILSGLREGMELRAAAAPEEAR